MTNHQSKILLELRGMTKAFPGVLANDNVDMALKSGEIHALLGENGAGKSTLVKMIYGILKADQGEIEWEGQTVTISNPAMARRLGIAMVFQHFSLFDSLSVCENIALGMEDAGDMLSLKEHILEVSNRYGLPLDPDRHVYTLSVGERQRIEIIRCLLQNPKMLVMDEPTSVLTPQEVNKLFETLSRLAKEGVAILYISHKLDEIKTLCQKATILRGGKVMDSVMVVNESANSLASRMMGQELDFSAREKSSSVGESRLRINHLNLPAEDEFGIPLRDISLSVHSGEIVGIAGVAGNGQDELLKAINGEITGSDNDFIYIDNEPCGVSDVNRRRTMGLASIPEERLGHGAVPNMSLNENSLLTSFRRLGFTNRGFINLNKCRHFCESVISTFNVKSNGSTSSAASLSGGNLQKFIVGREILQKPDILVVSQPTWGVDAGAAQTIHHALRGLAENGTAILVISQDLDELMKISDRITAICAGALSQVFPASEVTIEQIGLMMAGVQNGENHA
ncbi:MAG: ATP-binding cassette domain-containing protein [Gammaproteobacteria bacterium]|nr:ATP-binding cassette domain-containing protein [Gammaproteobacteria bacterium]